MIHVTPAVFAATCAARGYDLAAAMQCVVSERDGRYVVDETHPAYPSRKRPPQCLAGTHLSRLLGRFGITYSPGCKCRDTAAKMDRLGCEWCESDEGMGEILEAMRTEAAKRSLPFLDAVGKLLVRRAVKAARKEAAARGTEATGREGGEAAV